MQPFMTSGWTVSGQTPPGATAPATKWHLRMNRKGGPPMYLNVELDPMRKRSTITHEAAVRIGMRYEPFYMLFCKGGGWRGQKPRGGWSRRHGPSG